MGLISIREGAKDDYDTITKTDHIQRTVTRLQTKRKEIISVNMGIIQTDSPKMKGSDLSFFYYYVSVFKSFEFRVRIQKTFFPPKNRIKSN